MQKQTYQKSMGSIQYKAISFLPVQNKMQIKKICVIDQSSQAMEDLANKHQTTYGTCGFITCAMVKYLAIHNFHPQSIKNLGLYQLAPYIEDAMQIILARRVKQTIKYGLSEKDKKMYLKDWVANYQIEDYLNSIYESLPNKQIYFFRQVAHDHPQELKHVKLEESERVKVEEPFKGSKFMFNSFDGGLKFQKKQDFQHFLRKSNKKLPVIVATDILGHFNTTVLFQGQIYILQSLKKFSKQTEVVSIVRYIEQAYKQSYLIKQ